MRSRKGFMGLFQRAGSREERSRASRKGVGLDGTRGRELLASDDPRDRAGAVAQARGRHHGGDSGRNRGPGKKAKGMKKEVAKLGN